MDKSVQVFNLLQEAMSSYSNVGGIKCSNDTEYNMILSNLSYDEKEIIEGERSILETLSHHALPLYNAIGRDCYIRMNSVI